MKNSNINRHYRTRYEGLGNEWAFSSFFWVNVQWFRELGPSKVLSSGGNEEKGLGWRAKEEGDEVLARANNGARDYGGLEAVAFKGEDLA